MYGKELPIATVSRSNGKFFPRGDTHVQNQTDYDRRLPVRRGSVRAVRNAGVDHLPLPDVPESGRRTVRSAMQDSDRSIRLDPRRAASFNSSSVAERHFCSACGTPLTFHYLEDDAIEVTTGSLDEAANVPPTINFGTEARLPWIDLLAPGRLRDTPTSATRVVVSRQHPDHDTQSG
jgi:hypothetical protein